MTSWNLASADRLVALDLVLSGSETEILTGTIEVEGTTYGVAGSWAASGSVPGRNYSAFAVWGSTSESATRYVAAAGIMLGLAGAPTQIDIQVGVSSSADGTLSRHSATLLPSLTNAAKSQIVVLSDIHIGDNTNTVWYQKSIHEPYLLGILDWIVANAANIRELVMAGDVVDFWTYPFGTRPPTFATIAAQNPNIFGPRGLGRVLDALDGKVTYLPGNHDMAITAADVSSITSPGGHHVTLVDGPYLPLGADDHRIVITHGHDYTIFNAPDPASKWSPLPLGHFVTRMIATQTGKSLAPGKTVADVGGQGNPNSIDLLPIVTPVVAALVGGLPGSTVVEAIKLFYDLPTALLNQIQVFSQTSDTDPISLANGQSTTLAEVKTVYANLVKRWSQENDPQFAAKSTLADASGRYMGWFAQRLAFQVGAKLVVMGHTHTPISDLSGSMVHYVNSGFECPAGPDMPSQSVSFSVIDVTTCTASVQRAQISGNAVGIEPCPATTAPVVEFGLSDFSCYVTIENDGNEDLVLSSTSIGHGHFVVPPATIKAHSTAMIWLQDDPGLHGADATVTFKTSTGDQKFAFDCPTGVFSNACSGGTSFITKAGDGPWSSPGQAVTEPHPFFVQFRYNPAHTP